MASQPSRVRVLGRTTISSIYKYAHDDGSFSAGKEVSKYLYKHWETELRILQKVGKNHENVIRYFPNSNDVGESITFFMELCDGTLEEYILDKEIIPSTSDSMRKINAREYFQSDILDICSQTVKGLQQLHNAFDIIHRDMKPSNVLLIRTSQNTTIAKVADFGLSRELPTGSSSHFTTSTSTTAYMAKECYDKIWKQPSDIFALGIVLYFAFTGGKHPFGKESYKIEGNIIEEKLPDFDFLRDNDSAFNEEQQITMVDMIKRMIKHDPEERLHIDDVFCHPTFWDSRRKIDFFLKIRDDLHNDETTIPDKDVNEFDLVLLQDHAAGTKQKFQISESNLPNYLVLKKGKKRSKEEHHLIDKCRSVKTLLNVIQNQDAHAFGRNNPPQLRDDYGIEGDTLDSDKFLSVFIRPYPQLLIHLYELFRKSNGAADFYPRKVDQSPTSFLEQRVTAGEATAQKRPSVAEHTDPAKLDEPPNPNFMKLDRSAVTFFKWQKPDPAHGDQLFTNKKSKNSNVIDDVIIGSAPAIVMHTGKGDIHIYSHQHEKSSNKASNNEKYETEASNTNLQNSFANGSSYNLRKRNTEA